MIFRVNMKLMMFEQLLVAAGLVAAVGTLTQKGQETVSSYHNYACRALNVRRAFFLTRMVVHMVHAYMHIQIHEQTRTRLWICICISMHMNESDCWQHAMNHAFSPHTTTHAQTPLIESQWPFIHSSLHLHDKQEWTLIVRTKWECVTMIYCSRKFRAENFAGKTDTSRVIFFLFIHANPHFRQLFLPCE